MDKTLSIVSICPKCNSRNQVGINLSKEACKKANRENWYEMDNWYCYQCRITFNERKVL